METPVVNYHILAEAILIRVAEYESDFLLPEVNKFSRGEIVQIFIEANTQYRLTPEVVLALERLTHNHGNSEVEDVAPVLEEILTRGVPRTMLRDRREGQS